MPRLLLGILLAAPAAWSFSTTPRIAHRSTRVLLAKQENAGEAPDNSTSNQRYPTEPYIDPVTNRLSVDVSDLGLSMDDLGKTGWAEPDRVHPSPGEDGLNAETFVTMSGDIDWEAMAAALAEQE